LLSQTRRCLEQSIRINVIGRRDRLSRTLLSLIERSEAATAHCDRMLLRIAVDYSAQYSLIETARRLQGDCDVTTARYREVLAAVDHCAVAAPEVDLLIRTGGEKRLSDFLLWESAYAELLFVDTWWPDFDEDAFEASLDDFARRQRRYGRIDPAPTASVRHG
jgi:undecaprenyl diphosphate synthase